MSTWLTKALSALFWIKYPNIKRVPTAIPEPHDKNTFDFALIFLTFKKITSVGKMRVRAN